MPNDFPPAGRTRLAATSFLPANARQKERAMFDPKSKDHGNVIRAVPAPASSAQERESWTRQTHEPPWAFVRRNKTYPLLGVLAALLVAIAVETFVTPRYRATIEILIGPADLRLVEKSVLPASQASDANVMQVESETRILTSDRVLRRVVRGEHLVDDPEFQMRGGGGRFDGIVNALRSTVGKPLEQVKIADRELDALRLLQRKISAKRTERTYVVDLTVDSSDPEKSARIANAIGIAYTDEQAYARAETARRATDSLSSRLNEQRDRVSQAEEQVERYKAQHNIVDASGRLVDEQQLSELNNQLIAARGRSAEAKARYDQMLQLRRSGLDQGSIPEAVQSSTLGLLRDQYGTIARQEANLTAELGPRHPSVIEARAQLRNAQQQIADEVARIAEASRIAYERAQANETTLATNFALLKQRAMDTSLAFVKLRELEREAEASRAVYESFLVRTREIREQERLDTANVRILADAQAPEGRSFPPRRVLLLPALLVLGLVGGIGLAYLIELTRRPRPANDADDRSERALTEVTSTVPAE
jgi:succinoglycan biosynthesis transport protein ExoP